MNQTLIDFRNAVNASEELQQQVTAGAANGFSFAAEELNQGWAEL